MKKRYIASGILGLLLISGGVTAYTILPTTHAGSPSEMPELGRLGDHAIGTQIENISLNDRPIISASSIITGNVDPAPRSLRVRFWYPTDNNDTNGTLYPHNITVGEHDPIAVNFEGRAIENAAAKVAQKYPLVIMSHGFGGWAEHYSNLGEHIASRGYVVASIDHADAPATNAASWLLSFGNVLQNRSLDQREIIDHIMIKAAQNEDAGKGYYAAIDADKIGLLGYSMGGFGAIRTAGAPYDYSAESLGNIPKESQDTIKNGTQKNVPISALIAMAPWGATPENRSWQADSLGKISVPTLIIAGNQDDVSDFDDGISWIFENMTSSDRHMLIYREARHNIAGNVIGDIDFPANQDFTTTEYMREPVWRTERINAINQHFITAFLDLHLKGDSDKASYLNTPTENSNDGTWDIPFGEQLNGTLASREQASHWRGFQRRWAVGMTMKRKAKGE